MEKRSIFQNIEGFSEYNANTSEFQSQTPNIFDEPKSTLQSHNLFADLPQPRGPWQSLFDPKKSSYSNLFDGATTSTSALSDSRNMFCVPVEATLPKADEANIKDPQTDIIPLYNTHYPARHNVSTRKDNKINDQFIIPTFQHTTSLFTNDNTTLGGNLFSKQSDKQSFKDLTPSTLFPNASNQQIFQGNLFDEETFKLSSNNLQDSSLFFTKKDPHGRATSAEQTVNFPSNIMQQISLFDNDKAPKEHLFDDRPKKMPINSSTILEPSSIFSYNKTKTDLLNQTEFHKIDTSKSNSLFQNLSENRFGLFKQHSEPTNSFFAQSKITPPPKSPSACSPPSATIVKLTQVPAGMNQKNNLIRQFSRFGQVQRVVCQPSLDTTLIAFSTMAEAQQAKMEASQIIPGVTASLAKCVRRSMSSLSQRKCNASSASQLTTSTSSNAILSEPSSSNSVSLSLNEEGRSCIVGATVDERLALLESRDELQHQLQMKLGNRKQNSAQGTCPDMCPETERYLRESRQRVSVFECLQSSLQSAGSSADWRLDHSRTVKDYSRSSADQAEPLLWELRPPEVLRRTVAYLLANIADRPEIDCTRNLWKPWYEFLWTRTRAIRKDITQQTLCSGIVVAIVEKITRFHIFCAARLVDQPTDSFDPRINSENLTQCLQTLKELYGDLQENEGECPCEPEFRAYMILMKLNDCSVLNEVQKFPEALRKSLPVQFAVAVHSAVTEHNYVRFFRLVRQTTCLTACLLHRYFGQVRSQALLALAAAFAGHPRHEVHYPLTTLKHQLGFESNRDAQAFSEHWGLSVQEDDLIFKSQYPPREPELAWKERRAPHLIEEKRAGITLAVLFNGGPINPSDAIPSPIHSSFDANNRFIVKPIRISGNVEIQITQKPSPKIIPDFSLVPAQLSVPNFLKTDILLVPSPKHMVTQNLQPSLVQQVVVETLENLIDAQSQSIATFTLHKEIAVNSVADQLLVEVVNLNSFQVALGCMSELSNEISTTTENLASALVQKVVCQITRSIIKEIICEQVFLSIFDEILCEQIIVPLTENCLAVAQATELNQFYLQSVYFGRWRQRIFNKRQESRQSRHYDLAIFMPASPALVTDGLLLAGSKVADYCDSLFLKNQRRRSANPLLYSGSKRSRFSAWSEKVDLELAWKPIDPLTSLNASRIGVILCPDEDLLSNWVLAKLAKHLITIVISLNDVPHSGISTLIRVVSNKQQTPSHLPVLDLLTSPPNVFEETDTNTHTTLHFQSPPSSLLTLSYEWNLQLQRGLEWLSNCLEFQRHHSLTLKPEKPLFIHSYLPPSFASVFQSHIEHLFLSPLLVIIRQWSKQRFQDPSPHCLLIVYNECVGLFCDAYVSLCGKTEDEIFPALTLDAELKNSDWCSWTEVRKKWADFLTASLSNLSNEVFMETRHLCEVAMCRREKLSMTPPWALLFVYLVRGRLHETDESLSSRCLPNGVDKPRLFKAVSHACGHSQLSTWLQTRLYELGEPKYLLGSSDCQHGVKLFSSGETDCLVPRTSLVEPANRLLRQLREVETRLEQTCADVRDVLNNTF